MPVGGDPIQVLRTPDVDGCKPGTVAKVLKYLQRNDTFSIEYPLVA